MAKCLVKKMKERFEKFIKTKYGFITALGLVMFAIAIRNFDSEITEYNTTPFAVSYKYGFLSRAFLGSAYKFLDMILPFDMMSWLSIYRFTIIITIICLLMIILFVASGLKKMDLINSTEEEQKNIRYLYTILIIFSATEFVTEEMFGRFDTYLVLISMLMMILLVKEKFEWLVIPLSIVCMLIHQGFVFTNANAILVVLFVKIFIAEKRNRRKYIVLFVCMLLSISVLFLYFEFFSHTNGEIIVDQIISDAKALSEDGNSYNSSLINHEILGEGVFQDEIKLHMENYREFPAFLIIASPFLVLLVMFFKRVFKNKNGNIWVNLALLLGGITIIPEMIMKVDYGRYVYMTLYYYIVVIITLIILGYKPVKEELSNIKNVVSSHIPIPQLVLVYAMFMTPLYDVVINAASFKISTLLFFWIK